jgi:PAS domain S-box-containing protein
MNLIASQAAISLENAVLFEKTRNAEQRLQRQFEEIQSQYEEMEAINEELENTSRDLAQANDELTIFKKFVENSGQGFAMADFNKIITYANPALSRILHVDATNKIIGGNALDFYPEDEKENTVYKVINTVLHEEQWTGELMVLAPDGSLVPTIQNIFLIRDNAGNPQFISTIVTDITDRKKAELELKNTRNYLNNIFNSIPSLLIAVNSNGEIMQFNNAAEHYTGISAQNALTKPFNKILPFLEKYSGQIETVLSSQSPVNLSREAVLLEKKKYFNISVSPLLFKGENGAVIQIDDITSTVMIDEMMVQTEKMLSIGGLAAGMAHEINNPLGGIMMSAQNIMRRISPDLPKNIEAAHEAGISLERLHDYFRKREIDAMLQGIRQMCSRASQIVKNMLDFSRQSNAVKEHVDIRFLVEQALELAAHDYDLKKKYDFRNITIYRHYDDNLPTVRCIPTEIEQVILNLLKNATQAMWEIKQKEYVPVIIIRLYQQEKAVFIEIEDNGPGIDDDIKRRIFEPFFTTKEVGVGTGLGLSVSYNIITNNHHGTITAESASGKGARFTISLPMEN